MIPLEVSERQDILYNVTSETLKGNVESGTHDKTNLKNRTSYKFFYLIVIQIGEKNRKWYRSNEKGHSTELTCRVNLFAFHKNK